MTVLPCGRSANGEMGTGYTALVGDPKVRYRHGFKVIGCDPVLLGTTQDYEAAESSARSTAADRSRKISDLGGPREVEWWVQQVTVTATAVYDEPTGALLSEDELAALLESR